MIVFVVLLDPRGVTHEDENIVVVNKPECQLPLAVVTFDTPRPTAHAIAQMPPHMQKLLQSFAGRTLPAHFAQMLGAAGPGAYPGAYPGQPGAPPQVGPDGKPLPEWMGANGHSTSWNRQHHPAVHRPAMPPHKARAPKPPRRAPPPPRAPRRPKAAAGWADAKLRQALGQD